MENKGLVSVIIPVYNVEEYLEECIDSVLSQTYPYFEIILVDDGSIDKSGSICDEYVLKDNRISVIHQENRGLSEARNAGVEKATGKYIYFLDSDDWILPETFEQLVEKMNSTNADFVFFDAKSFEDGNPEKAIKQNYLRYKEYKTNSGYNLLKELQENNEYHSAVPLLFIRKKFYDNFNLNFIKGILYEDMVFTYEVFCRAEKAAYINKAFYQRRYRSGSIMTSKKAIRNFRSAKEIYEHVRIISEKLKVIDDQTAQKYISRCAFNAMNYYKALEGPDKKICKEEYKGIKENILNDGAYNNKALYMRCYGTLPWFIYKCFEKIFITGTKG